MNYQAHYDALIIKAQSRTKPECYTERHHILPRSLGGNDSSTNLVSLTAREHCLAHLLLAKIHGGKLWIAARFMTNRFSLNSRAYAIVREEHSLVISKMRLGRKHSEKTKQKMRKAKSEEAKKNIGLAKMGSKNPQYGKSGVLSPTYKGDILATHIVTGKTFIIQGPQDMIKNGFRPKTVSKCVLGQRNKHKDHTFKRI